MSEVVGEQIILPFGASLANPTVEFTTGAEAPAKRYTVHMQLGQLMLSQNSDPSIDFNLMLKTQIGDDTQPYAQDHIFKEKLTPDSSDGTYDFSTGYKIENSTEIIENLARERIKVLESKIVEQVPERNKLRKKYARLFLLGNTALALAIGNRFGYDLLSDTPYNDVDRVFDSLAAVGYFTFVYSGIRAKKLEKIEKSIDKKANRVDHLQGFLDSVRYNGLRLKPKEQ